MKNRPPTTNPDAPHRIILYGWHRSSCSHRVQIGLRLKGLSFDYVPVNLDIREQETPEFRAVNPGGQIPVLVVDGHVYTHAFPMLELLEELFPETGAKLLPAEPLQRARAREITQVVACLMQPFQLPWSIRKRLVEALDLERHPLGADGACRAFSIKQLKAMLPELNRLVSRCGGSFSVGDAPSVADCAVIPQLVAAAGLGLDINAYPHLSKVFETCSKHEAFQAAHPEAVRREEVAVQAAEPARRDGAAGATAGEPSNFDELMAYKDSGAEISRYLSVEANTPIPQFEYVRQEAFRLFGPVATKISARDVCFFLRWLAGQMNARCVVEVGVFTGSSSLALLQGMPTDGRLIAFEVSSEYADVAREAWRRGNSEHRVDLRLVDAVQGLKALSREDTVRGKVDLAYIDGANWLYRDFYELTLPLMRAGGVIVLDNVLWKGRVASPQPDDDEQTVHLRALNAFLRDDPRVSSCVLAMGDGLGLATRLP